MSYKGENEKGKKLLNLNLDRILRFYFRCNEKKYIFNKYLQNI